MSHPSRPVAVILGAVLLLLTVGSAWTQEYLAVTVDAQVLVSDREVVGLSITDWADSIGGYFVLRTLDQVVIRVPVERVAELRRHLEELEATVLRYNPGAYDLREDLFGVTAGITSRTEAIDQILLFLDDSDVSATLSFERELRGLMDELEYFTGRRRQIINDSTYARATVHLSSRQQSIPQQRPSSFDWINSVDLYRFLNEVPR